jgi:hypothetical protein
VDGWSRLEASFRLLVPIELRLFLMIPAHSACLSYDRPWMIMKQNKFPSSSMIYLGDAEQFVIVAGLLF